jgi:rare lipoprotein A
MRAILAVWTVSLLTSTISWASLPPSSPIGFLATAYAQSGRTASGAITRIGLVAADPAVLPLGSLIRVTGAGPYSGEYKVADTGKLVRGNHIDIYMPSRAAAIRFGRKQVTVQVTRLGGPGRKTHRGQNS